MRLVAAGFSSREATSGACVLACILVSRADTPLFSHPPGVSAADPASALPRFRASPLPLQASGLLRVPGRSRHMARCHCTRPPESAGRHTT
ncbi:hypothetical protein BSU04_11450 [Caballeronia sordidicola]|uniref:Uncharacterized protein n=1 Tax=Caballeronia sordidicola TaxID=196367 RepID=A0A226X4H6_CABSO|nr:hypothetical protein BSU04_11450 [Caballeronia sordidicola]